MIGGATTSKIHTAVKIAPKYSGLVIHGKDASQNSSIAMQLMNDVSNKKIKEGIAAEYQAIRDKQVPKSDLLSLDEAKKRKPKLF